MQTNTFYDYLYISVIYFKFCLILFFEMYCSIIFLMRHGAGFVSVWTDEVKMYIRLNYLKLTWFI